MIRVLITLGHGLIDFNLPEDYEQHSTKFHMKRLRDASPLINLSNMVNTATVYPTPLMQPMAPKSCKQRPLLRFLGIAPAFNGCHERCIPHKTRFRKIDRLPLDSPHALPDTFLEHLVRRMELSSPQLPYTLNCQGLFRAAAPCRTFHVAECQGHAALVAA